MVQNRRKDKFVTTANDPMQLESRNYWYRPAKKLHLTNKIQ